MVVPLLGGLFAVALSAWPSSAAQAERLSRGLHDAIAYAHRHDIRAGVAAIDLRTGALTEGGDPGTYGSASVVKVLIAARLILTHKMTPAVSRRAYHMIIGSDDHDADVLWPMAGRSRLVPWLDAHYRINIGKPNFLPGRWGNTQLRAAGLARFYYRVYHDESVWPWLHRAMAHTKKWADDGTDQYFGIPAAGGGHVVKQGWGGWSAGDWKSATINTTGFVSTARGEPYALVILTQGHDNDGQTNAEAFNAPQAAVATRMARYLLPGGHLRLG